MTQAQNQYLDYLIDSSFQEMKRLFALRFENITNRNANTRYCFPSMPLISISRENTIETSLASELPPSKILQGRCVKPGASFHGRNKFF